jgi:PadR family transcriptional regulator PadR
MEQGHQLGWFEEIVLLAVAGMEEGTAYGVPIWEAVEQATKRPTNPGAIYATLERLQDKGYVSSWRGDPTPERGGRAKRFFRIEGLGRDALSEKETVRKALRGGFGRRIAGGAL